MESSLTMVLPFLYLGGKSVAKDKEMLQEKNIRYIVNCTPSKTIDPKTGVSNYHEKKHGSNEYQFKYLRVPIFDNSGENILFFADSVFNFIEEGRHHGQVLIHCHRGVSRSASFVILYLMKFNEMTLTEALSYLQTIRPIVSPNEAFLNQLKKFEEELLRWRQQQQLQQHTVISHSDIVPHGPQLPRPLAEPTITTKPLFDPLGDTTVALPDNDNDKNDGHDDDNSDSTGKEQPKSKRGRINV